MFQKTDGSGPKQIRLQGRATRLSNVVFKIGNFFPFFAFYVENRNIYSVPLVHRRYRFRSAGSGVADPHHFETDPDPGSEKIRYGSDCDTDGDPGKKDTDPDPG